MNHAQANILRALAPLLLAAPGLAQSASFTGLGFLSNEDPWSECSGISDDGTIVAGYTRGPGLVGENQGFYWSTSTGMVPIGNPPLTSGTPSGTANDISGDGWVIVGTSRFDGLNTAGFTWSPVAGFSPLAASTLTSLAKTVATNGDGTVSVGETRHGGLVGMNNTFIEATVWYDDGMIEGIGLGLLPGGTWSEARGVSRNGRVIVGEARRGYEEGVGAFRWDATNGFVALGDLPGGYFFSRANAASTDGSIIVGYGTVSFGGGFTVDHRACTWDADGIHELPNLPGKNGITEATDISPDGRFIVGWVRNAAVNVPAIWDDVHGVRNLFEVMTQAGIDVSSWQTGYATAVSADGKTIVGHGRRGAPATTEAWVCTLP